MHSNINLNVLERPFSSFECYPKVIHGRVEGLFLRKSFSPFNLGGLLSPFESLIREKSAIFAFHAGAQNVCVGQF